MRIKQKQYSFDMNQKVETGFDSSLFGYNPNPPLVFQHQTSIPRKISLIDLRSKKTEFSQIFQSQEKNDQSRYKKDIFTKKKALDIIKEAQIQLYSSQQPRIQIRPQKVKTLTLDNQSEAMNFTFAQNFSNKQNIMKEFSANSLSKKFFI